MPLVHSTNVIAALFKKLQAAYSLPSVDVRQTVAPVSNTRIPVQDVRFTSGDASNNRRGYTGKPFPSTFPAASGPTPISATSPEVQNSTTVPATGSDNTQLAYSVDKYRFQQATKQALNFYNKKPQFAGSIDEDWPWQLRQFCTIRPAYRIKNSDKVHLFRHTLSPSSTAHQLLKSINDCGDCTWSTIVNKFEPCFHNAATPKQLLNKLSALRVDQFCTSEEKDDNGALEKLLTELDRL